MSKKHKNRPSGESTELLEETESNEVESPEVADTVAPEASVASDTPASPAPEADDTIVVLGRFAGSPHPGVMSRIRAGICWHDGQLQEHRVTRAQLEELRADPYLDIRFPGMEPRPTHTPTAVEATEHEAVIAALQERIADADSAARRKVEELVRKHDLELAELHEHHQKQLAEKDAEIAELRERQRPNMFPFPPPGEPESKE
jgi:hypothetical protein